MGFASLRGIAVGVLSGVNEPCDQIRLSPAGVVDAECPAQCLQVVPVPVPQNLLDGRFFASDRDIDQLSLHETIGDLERVVADTVLERYTFPLPVHPRVGGNALVRMLDCCFPL